MEENTSTLTGRQAAVLDFIRRSIMDRGYPPTRREIEEAAEISSVGTEQSLQELEEKGYIEVDRNRARGIKLKSPPASNPNVRVPIQGKISAGVPTVNEPFTESGQSVDISSDLLPPNAKRTRLYALRVQGNGLIDVSIQDGDLVILESNGSAKGRAGLAAAKGDIVAVRLPERGEMVLTRLYRDKEGYRLQPANQGLETIHVPQRQKIRIEGKVVAVIRSFKV